MCTFFLHPMYPFYIYIYIYIIPQRFCDVLQFVLVNKKQNNHKNNKTHPTGSVYSNTWGESTVTVDGHTPAPGLGCQSFASCPSGRCTCVWFPACDDELPAAGFRGPQQDFCVSQRASGRSSPPSSCPLVRHAAPQEDAERAHARLCTMW